MDNVRGPVPNLDAKLLRNRESITVILNSGREIRCEILEVGRYSIHVKIGTRELLLPKRRVKYYVLKEDTAGDDKDWDGMGLTLQGKVNINIGSVQEISSLPGLGTTTAERIVNHREVHGPFENKAELLQIRGIGRRRWEQVKEDIIL